MLAARQVRRAKAPPDLVAGEERHAISQLRALDRHHLKRTQAIQQSFSNAFGDSPLIAEHRAQIAALVQDCDTVMITGGHVLVLLNRLQLFGLAPHLAARNIVAWSAGAMVLSERVVLFHDETPQGRRDPELLGLGLGLIPGHVFLPDARRRLRRRDPVRTSVFNRRFSPARCVTLDSGALLHLRDGKVHAAQNVAYLTVRGGVRDVVAP
jgi:peptidase E